MRQRGRRVRMEMERGRAANQDRQRCVVISGRTKMSLHHGGARRRALREGAVAAARRANAAIRATIAKLA
jgi:hypothetical protein